MKYENYDIRDKYFWKCEKEAGEALVKFAKDGYDKGEYEVGDELLWKIQKQRVYIAQLKHELAVADKYQKMWEKNWQDFHGYVQEKQ